MAGVRRCASWLEASLLAAQSAAAAFGLLRFVEGASVAASVVAATAIVATVVVAIGWGATEIALLARRAGAILCDIETQFAAADLASVNLLDR